MPPVFYITKSDWWEAKSDPIRLEEWISLCKADARCRLESQISGKNPKTGEVITMAGEAMAFFRIGDEEVLFDYQRGKIAIPYDEAVVEPAREIASRLGCRLQDEEGELL